MQGDERGNFFTELLKLALLVIVIVVPVRLWVAQPFLVSGASMEPTFDSGEYLIVDEFSYHLGEPRRFDIIIFRYPKDPSKFYIKRIVGLPGEKLEIADNSIRVTHEDGSSETLAEPYVALSGNGPAQTVTLEDGEYFVMGDNRPDSSDSRYWGPLPREDIIGRALLRLLPIQNIALLPGEYAEYLR